MYTELCHPLKFKPYHTPYMYSRIESDLYKQARAGPTGYWDYSSDPPLIICIGAPASVQHTKGH